ncbi:regenerating islet-derived protein 4-like protein, partial [Aphelenchoides avenae]
LAFANGLNLWIDVWIGLHDPYHTRQWKWTDGSSVDFINWNPGEPNNVNGTEACVMMAVGTGPPDGDYGSKSFGKWNDIKCDAEPYGGICQKPAVV